MRTAQNFVRVLSFVLCLYLFYANVRLWNTPLHNAASDGNDTKPTIGNKIQLCSPSVLFYGQRDDWVDDFFYRLLFFFVFLLGFCGVCLDCWPLVVPLNVVAGREHNEHHRAGRRCELQGRSGARVHV
ncbi:hypothetical protein M3Y99_00910000 [Aphelenchoides fujianensis]|nr:hypothetical protein M3Y99_00910000 [Aphelenchoides fujianensis]